jgi:Arc/MetJ-type ribon-helix-helix transcriptional regulator
MKRSRRMSIDVPRDQIEQVRHLVEAGEFASTSAVIREALRAFLHRRALHAGQLGASRLSRTLQARLEPGEPFERVDLLFDAGDAKA